MYDTRLAHHGSYRMRKYLSMPALLKKSKDCFSKIKETGKRKKDISLGDCLMSGLAVFSLKYPSLLQFDRSQGDKEVTSNLKSLYQIAQVPSDTTLRERLDEVNPAKLRPLFTSIFGQLQRGKELEKFEYLDGHYLLSIDGTGYFSSREVHCDSCCEKHHRDGHITYYHQMLGAVLVHPDLKEVIPFAPEPILKQDGKTKNDCERNASKRLLDDFQREHPHLKIIVIEDGLASNAPHIQKIIGLGMHFILGAKPKDHKFLFDWVEHSQASDYEYKDEKGVLHRFRYLNKAPLNDANFELEVNFLEYWEIKPNGKRQHFTWVTDIELNDNNVFEIMRGGRARWKIENETFNTLKNQGYHFEHNFGHGYKHLSTVFAYLMLLAFLIDQIQSLSCKLFKLGVEKAKSRMRFWEKIRGYFFHYLVNSWEDLYHVLAYGKQPTSLRYDTS